MARSADPLQRDAIQVTAQLPGARLAAPRTNAALQLADALKDATPEARAAMATIADSEADKARTRAKQDALKAEGQPLADAVRSGQIDATQNPWYMSAYKRESASIRSLDALQKLQTESASWDTYNDPEKFSQQWRETVGSLAEGFGDTDSMAGFQAAQNQVTSQVLQENVARNVARIKTERLQNLGALTADGLQSVYRANAGRLSPNAAKGAIGAAEQQWFATGGSEADWHEMLVKSITNLAYATQDSSVLDLLKAPELLHGPSAQGDIPAGVGAHDTSDYAPPHVTSPAPASFLAQAPKPAVPGNLPLGITQRAQNADGSVSTVRTISIGTDKGEVLIPTVVGNKVVSNEEAIKHYRETGENFGTFSTVAEADAYAEALHKSHEQQLSPKVTVRAPSTKLTAFPVPAARVSSEFGARKAPKAGASTNHRGMDLAVPLGTPVQAQATGKVVSAKDEGRLGNTVRVDYGNGVVGIYGHLDSMDVKPGDIVTAGQGLAKSGNSGNSTGPHLHYQLMVNGKATNPRTFTGNVGGSFEAEQAAANPQQYPGFPTGAPDAPFDAGGVTPGNVLNRGPSLYGMPGVADQVESDRYRINEAAAAAPMQRARVLKAQREARGYEASDVLWQNYGTGLLTGHVTRDQVLKTLGDKGYSGPEIAEALQQVNSVLRDSVGVANAQVAARGQNPGNAMEVLEIASDAQRSGWTPQLETRVGRKVLDGTLTGDDGRAIISSAISRSNQQRSEQRAEDREARAEARAGGGVSNWKGLRESSTHLRDLVVQTIAQQMPQKAAAIRSTKAMKAIQDRITTAMGAWLAANPEDFAGALQAGKDESNKALLEAMGQFPRAGSTPQPSAPAGGNPRRQ